MAEQPVFSIRDVNARVRAIVERETIGKPFWIEGSVRKHYVSDLNHQYFELYDSDNFAIRCMVRDTVAADLPFSIANGVDLEIFGTIRVFEKRASLEFEVEQAKWVESVLPRLNDDVKARLEKENLWPKPPRTLPNTIKYLSVNCHIHQNVSASKLNQGQPILDFLTPTHAQTAAFSQPTESPLNDPAACGELGFARHGTILNRWFTSAATVFDMGNIAFLFNKLMDIIIIIAPVHADMLFTVCGVRTRDHYRDNQVIRRPFIMRIGARDVNGQRRTAFIDQQVNLAALFASVRRIAACGVTAQRSRTAFTINRLPFPFDLAFLGIEFHHDLHNPVKNAKLLPGLESFMQGTAAHAEPVPMNRFPLTAGPQHIPNPIEYRSIVCRWSSSPSLFRLFGQDFLDFAPQRARHAKVIDIFRFWGSIVAQVASRFSLVGSTPILHEMRLFFTPQSFYG
jgi:hypothetical protein